MWITTKYKYLIYVTILVLLPMILMGIILLSLFREKILVQFQNEQSAILSYVKQNSIEQKIEAIEQILKEYSKDSRIPELSPSSNESLLLKKEWRLIADILSLDINIYYGSQQNQFFSNQNFSGNHFHNITTSTWYVLGQNQTKILWTDPYISDKDSEIILSATQSIFDNKGSFKGVMAVDISLNSFFNSFKQESFKNNTKMLVIIDNHKVINFSRNKSEPIEYNKLYNWQDIIDAPNGRKLIDLNDKKFYTFSIYLKKPNLILVSLLPVSALNAEIKPLLQFLSMIILFFSIFMIIGSVFTSRIDQLQKINHQKELLINLRTTLLHILSHNASTPITILFNNSLDLLEEDDSNEEYRQMFLAAGNIKSLMENTMVYLKLEEGITDRTKQLVDLKDLTEMVCRMYKPLLKAKHLDLELNLEDQFVEGHYFLIKIVLENLIDNAVKYSNPEGKIIINECRRKNKLIWSIQDNGPGIKDHYSTQLYRKFRKLSAKPTGGESSSGLGLYLVQKLMALLGGEIKLDTSVAEGAKFTLKFPVPSSGGIDKKEIEKPI